MESSPLPLPIALQEACHEGHAFRPPRAEPPGNCHQCGLEVVDWARVHRREISDWQYTLRCLQSENLRREFWQGDIDDRAIERYTKTTPRTRELAERRLRQSIGKVYGTGPNARPFRDGYQTPKQGDVLFYAQHALACCCRRCSLYWHGVPYGRALSDDEVGYFAELILRFIHARMPGYL